MEGKYIGIPAKDPVFAEKIRYELPYSFAMNPHACYNEIKNMKQITGKTPTVFGINVSYCNKNVEESCVM